MEIIATIWANPMKFDLSPNGLIALNGPEQGQNALQATVLRGSGEVNLPAVQPNRPDPDRVRHIWMALYS